MLTIGWLVVIFGVLAVQWADGHFPFFDTVSFSHHWVTDVTFKSEKA
jgi:hypothetical protein